MPLIITRSGPSLNADRWIARSRRRPPSTVVVGTPLLGPGPHDAHPPAVGRRDAARRPDRSVAEALPDVVDRPGWRRPSARPAGASARRRRQVVEARAARPARRTSTPRRRAGARPASRSTCRRAAASTAATMASAVSIGAGERGRPGDRAEAAVAHLERHRPGAHAVARAAAGDGVGQPDHLAADVGAVVEVVGERLLVADRLDLPLGLDRPVVAAAGEVEEVPAVGLAERGRRRPPVERGQVADGGDAEPLQPRSSVAGPTPHSGRPAAGGGRQLLARADHEHAEARVAPRRRRPAAWPPPTPAWRGTCSAPRRPSTSGRARRGRRRGSGGRSSTPSPSSRRAPVTSRNASSSASGSTSGVTSRRSRAPRG